MDIFPTSFKKCFNKGNDFLFVDLPFGPIRQPSIGLTLLRQVLIDIGQSAEIAYLKLPFANLVSTEFYNKTVDHYPDNLLFCGDWLFSQSLNGSSDFLAFRRHAMDLTADPLSNSAEEISKFREEFNDYLLELQSYIEVADQFIDAAVEFCLELEPKIIGLTSTFQQHTACLAFSKKIKARCPEIKVIMGGANCEKQMGLQTLKSFPFLDAVVSGYGEEVIAKLRDVLLNGDDGSKIPGLYTRQTIRDQGHDLPHPSTAIYGRAMDDLPMVEFDDFFEQRACFEKLKEITPFILAELSRGCWWGAKHHCTFCGLNPQTMHFRSKSQERAAEELKYLLNKYEGIELSVVDNIVDMQYFKVLFPQMADWAEDRSIFLEIKSNLSRDQVSILSEAGVTKVQPGIESFSNPILREMDKGVTALRNIQLLKWLSEYGIRPSWNLISGFPSEDPDEYASMAELCQALFHLEPPNGPAQLRLDRFSPNHTRSEQLGFKNVRAAKSYALIYGKPSEELNNLAYYFDFEYQDKREVRAYSNPLIDACRSWRSEFSSSVLIGISKQDNLLVLDTRDQANCTAYMLAPIARRIVEISDGVTSGAKIYSEFDEDDRYSHNEISEALEMLISHQILLEQDGMYLSLPVLWGPKFSPHPDSLIKLKKHFESAGSLEPVWIPQKPDNLFKKEKCYAEEKG